MKKNYFDSITVQDIDSNDSIIIKDEVEDEYIDKHYDFCAYFGASFYGYSRNDVPGIRSIQNIVDEFMKTYRRLKHITTECTFEDTLFTYPKIINNFSHLLPSDLYVKDITQSKYDKNFGKFEDFPICFVVRFNIFNDFRTLMAIFRAVSLFYKDDSSCTTRLFENNETELGYNVPPYNERLSAEEALNNKTLIYRMSKSIYERKFLHDMSIDDIYDKYVEYYKFIKKAEQKKEKKKLFDLSDITIGYNNQKKIRMKA